MDGLTGRHVLITGGASGIGAATAERFLNEGSKVVVLDRDQLGCERIKKLLPQLAGSTRLLDRVAERQQPADRLSPEELGRRLPAGSLFR